jgi:hypothetical protein
MSYLDLEVKNDLKFVILEEITNLISYSNHPLRLKEIIKIIETKYNFKLFEGQIKNLIKTKLIDNGNFFYDEKSKTYSKDSNFIKNQNSTTLNSKENNRITVLDFLKLEIHKIINNLYPSISFSESKILNSLIFKVENNIENFDIENENHKIDFIKIVETNFITIKKLYFFFFRITNKTTLINSILKGLDDETTLTVNEVLVFSKIFSDLFNSSISQIQIIDQKKFNKLKDDIEFLYEAYDKLYTDITGNVFDSQSIVIEKTLLNDVIKVPEKAELIEKSVKCGNETDNNIQSELIKIKTNLEENLNKLINLTKINNVQINSDEEYNNWKIISDNLLIKNIKIDFLNKKVIFKNSKNLSNENLFKQFLENLSIQRNYNRTFELDLFFENLQEFYIEDDGIQL